MSNSRHTAAEMIEAVKQIGSDRKGGARGAGVGCQSTRSTLESELQEMDANDARDARHLCDENTRLGGAGGGRQPGQRRISASGRWISRMTPT